MKRLSKFFIEKKDGVSNTIYAYMTSGYGSLIMNRFEEMEGGWIYEKSIKHISKISLPLEDKDEDETLGYFIETNYECNGGDWEIYICGKQEPNEILFKNEEEDITTFKTVVISRPDEFDTQQVTCKKCLKIYEKELKDVLEEEGIK